MKSTIEATQAKDFIYEMKKAIKYSNFFNAMLNKSEYLSSGYMVKLIKWPMIHSAAPMEVEGEPILFKVDHYGVRTHYRAFKPEGRMDVQLILSEDIPLSVRKEIESRVEGKTFRCYPYGWE